MTTIPDPVRSSRLLRILGLAGGAIGLTVTVYTLIVQITTAGATSPDFVYLFAGLGSLVVGSLLINSKPFNVIGWILLSHGLVWTITETCRSYLWVSYEFGAQPLDELALWLVAWMSPAAWLPVPLLVAYFPNGRVETRWLRWPVRIGAAILGFFVLTGMLAPGDVADPAYWLEGLRNTWGIPWLDGIHEVEAAYLVADVMSLYWAALAITIVVDVLRRWRRSVGVERLQMRWFGLGVLATILILISSLVVARVTTEYTLLERFLTASAFGAIPVSVGIAASRYRLYEIDRLVSRAVTYSLVVGLTAAVFGGVILLLGSLSPFDGPGPVAISTLAAAAAFTPIRRRLQIRVDRRFNREKYNAEREIEQFASRLRTQADLEDLSQDLLGVVQTTMHPSSTSLWIAERESEKR